MKKLEVKGVLFDLWGTLIYNIPPAISLASLSKPLGIEPDVFWREWRKYMKDTWRGEIKSGEERARLTLADLGLPPDSASHVAEYERLGRTNDVHFYPGVPEMLEELQRRGYKTSVVSNTNYLARPVIERLELPEKLNQVILSCEVGLIKPDVKIYQLAAHRLGLETNECLFVGDGNDNELNGALQAGCVVGVVQQERGYAFRNPGDFPSDTDIQLPSVIDVLDYL